MEKHAKPRVMSSQTLNDFKDSLKLRGVSASLDSYLLERIPFLFNQDWDSYRDWKRHLSSLIDVDPKNICIVGSAAIGISINPHKGFKSFDDSSDIDVAIISDFHFQLSWRALRQTNLSNIRDHKTRVAIKEHRERHIYYGCIAADRIIAVLPFKLEWTTAMSAMAAIHPTQEREVKFRIYRDYDALRAYHANGLEALQTKLTEA